MASIEKFIGFLFKWEGGLSNDPDDAGGLTNMGVTYKTWLTHGIDLNKDGEIDEKDLALISRQDVVRLILKPHYWDQCGGDYIKNQAIANLIVDWYWCSGIVATRKVQRVLGVTCDGLVGRETLRAINEHPDTNGLFLAIRQARVDYLQRLCEIRPQNRKFLQGWMNRINEIRN